MLEFYISNNQGWTTDLEMIYTLIPNLLGMVDH